MSERIHSKFEQNFIERTYSSIVTDTSVAFSELVANSWDAGATRVDITLPIRRDEDIVIEDNGTGMTDEEFQQRWMVIAYNRVAHQGEYIEVASSTESTKRLAYGRNGVGRHSMLCFDDEYRIDTWRNGTCNTYIVRVDGGDSAFSVVDHDSHPQEGMGTRLIVKAKKRLPAKSEIMKTLGYRFLFDPEFSVYVNGDRIKFENRILPSKQQELSLKNGGKVWISIYPIPEGEKTTATNGIAFWTGGRLVGNPSWFVGTSRVEDARRKFALRHLIVVKADCLINEVGYDWSQFKDSEIVKETFSAVVQFVRSFRIEYYRLKVTETKRDVIVKNIDTIETLSAPAQYDLSVFFEKYLEQKPEVDSDELNIIIEALVSVLQSRNGLSLLGKLSMMGVEDVDGLNRILDEWSVSDIREVLDEIDHRLKVILAIEQLCSDITTDELHVLHPLISQAKWLFGIEYDNPYFTFNRRLTTVLRDMLQSERKENLDINWAKRPDLVIGDSFSISSTCTEEADENEVMVVNKILIIELKKGGFTITRKEMTQAEEYIDAIYRGNRLNCKPKIKAFVIGDAISAAISTRKVLEDYGEVCAYTYHQLIQTANKRLFDLKDKLVTHYEEIRVKNFLSEILEEPRQLAMGIGGQS